LGIATNEFQLFSLWRQSSVRLRTQNANFYELADCGGSVRYRTDSAAEAA
jgi:hypothetical protein